MKLPAKDRDRITSQLLGWFGNRDVIVVQLGELATLFDGMSGVRGVDAQLATLARLGFSVTSEGARYANARVKVSIVDPKFGGKITRKERAAYANSPTARVAPVRAAHVADTFLPPLLAKADTRLEPGSTYRVLSIRPPWAWAVFALGKDVENRSWTTKHRGPLLIHASSNHGGGDSLDLDREQLALAARVDEEHIPTRFPRSQILGLVDLVDVVDNSRSRWASPDSFHWVLRNPRLLAPPIEGVGGKLNLWSWTA